MSDKVYALVGCGTNRFEKSIKFSLKEIKDSNKLGHFQIS
jgi:hypothetical protein